MGAGILKSYGLAIGGVAGHRTADHAASGGHRASAGIALRPLLVVAPLAGVSLAVLLMSLFQDVARFAFPAAGLGHVWRLDVDTEVSIPTWLASSVILINALLLAAIGAHKFATREPLRWHWLWLGGSLPVSRSMRRRPCTTGFRRR